MKIPFSGWLFVSGLICFVFWLILPSHWRYLTSIGWTMLVFAYFEVLFKNYMAKAPIPTRGGFVSYGEKRGSYRLIYSVLFLAGIGALFVLWTRALFGE